MSGSSYYALLVTALGTGLLHTLIPDHWLPFVLIGRARGWSGKRTAVVSGLSASLHVGLSLLLGILALGIGLTVTEVVGQTLELTGTLAVIAFGLAYAFWSWRKGGHFHPGGAMFLYGDGSVHFHSESMNPETFVSLFTRAGGDIVAPD